LDLPFFISSGDKNKIEIDSLTASCPQMNPTDAQLEVFISKHNISRKHEPLKIVRFEWWLPPKKKKKTYSFPGCLWRWRSWMYGTYSTVFVAALYFRIRSHVSRAFSSCFFFLFVCFLLSKTPLN
jgi:hypothetical protein